MFVPQQRRVFANMLASCELLDVALHIPPGGTCPMPHVHPDIDTDRDMHGTWNHAESRISLRSQPKSSSGGPSAISQHGGLPTAKAHDTQQGAGALQSVGALGLRAQTFPADVELPAAAGTVQMQAALLHACCWAGCQMKIAALLAHTSCWVQSSHGNHTVCPELLQD